jgi:hypothetical protein
VTAPQSADAQRASRWIYPPPPIPWQVTGNHWLSLPCIHPVDASIHLVGVVNAKARSAVELAGAREFLSGDAPPLARLTLTIDGKRESLGAGGMVWEREGAWIPTFSSSLGQLGLRGTICAPAGKQAELPGLVIHLSVENRGAKRISVAAELVGVLGWKQLRIRTPREITGPAFTQADRGEVLLGCGNASELLTLAFAAADAEGEAFAGPGGEWGLSLPEVSIESGARDDFAFIAGAATEPDGAVAMLDSIRRRGWRHLMDRTRAHLAELEQATSEPSVDRLINRNLSFAFHTGVVRGLDDGRIYPVRSRMPWNGRGLTVRAWDVLVWLLPALQLGDPAIAREILLRMCELHGHAPGNGVSYLDGTLFEDGFSLEGAAAFPIAVDEYIVQTNDDAIVEEPALAEALYAAHEEIAHRKHPTLSLYSTELGPTGAVPQFPYTTHANAVAAYGLEVLSRTLDAKTAEKVQDAEAVRAAVLRHLSAEGKDGRSRLLAASDLDGHVDSAYDPAASLYWLPYFHLIGRDDSVYRRTVKQWDGTTSSELIERCARLVGPDPSGTLQWLRRAPLDNGVAAELVDESGRAIGNGGDAALAGLVAYLAWYAVHALGARA